MEDEVARTLSKEDPGKKETDKEVPEEITPLKAETNDEKNVNDRTERETLSEQQTELVQQSSVDQEQSYPPQEVAQPNLDQETTPEELKYQNVSQEISSEEQEPPITHRESIIGEEDIPHVDQETTPEETEQQSTSQEQPLEQYEQLSADQGMITEEQSDQIASQEEQVIGDQFLGDQGDPVIVQALQIIGQEQPLEQQEQLSENQGKIIEKQSDRIAVQEEQVAGEGVHLDHAEPVIDKQEQTFVSEDQNLAEDTVADSLQNNTRSTQKILEFQKTLSSDMVTNATATVKIMVVPDGHVVTMAFPIGFTAGMLKEYFASQLKIPQMVIEIMFGGKIVQDTETLMDLGVRPHGTIQLEMLSTDQDTYPIKAIKPQQEYNMPDVITVKVQTDCAAYQDVVVEIERLTFHKPYLGGYKHKLTGAEFHHAGTQTVPKKRPDKGIGVFCRDTQTVETKNKYQQSRNTTSTQMTKIGCYVANITDKLIEPNQYTTAAEYHSRRLKAVIVIQKYYRRLSAKRLVEELRIAKIQRLEWECQEELRKMKEKEDRLRREHERRMNPKTKEDFEILYHALEMWRQEEIERINNTLTGAERKAALCAILEQETQLIASIERYKQDANVENHREAIQSFLDKCSQPKKWKAFDGKTTKMYTQYTIRARELRDIYSSINIKHLNPDERLDALLTLKQTVKEHDCKLTQEIVELIDREADLLMRGVQDCNLEGLRKRISTLFLQYIKTPMFNPEVARLLKVPQDPAVLCKNIYFCPSCKSYLPSTEFSLSANARTVGRCRQCAKLDNQARHREDFSKYKLILKQLKKSEADYKDEARIAFLLQEQDIQYLVDNIWAAQSILSAWDDLYDLVIARWDKYVEWAPWNCILLTKDEAVAHLKLSNAEQAYGVAFIRKVKHKHTLAKNYFSQIPEMAPFLHEDFSHCKRERNDLLITKPVPADSHA